MDGSKKIPYDKLRSLEGPNGIESVPLLSTVKSVPPPDRCMFTYMIFFLHGIGHLLPWNFFITANLYFKTKFTCPIEANPMVNSTCVGYEDSFENYFSVASMVPIAFMTALNIWLQSKLRYQYRMVLSLVIMMVLFALTIAFVGIPTESWVDGFFGVTLLIVVVLSVASAIFQSSTFGFAGVFPPKYTSIVLSGQASAGIFAAVAQVLSLALVGNKSTDSAFGYFAVALLVVIICLASFFLMLPMKFIKYYLNQTSYSNIKAKQGSVVQASVNVKIVDTSVPYWKIFKGIWLYAVSVFLVFAVTLSLFPGVLAIVQSMDYVENGTNVWSDTYFTPLVCFLLFNVSDFVGRFITHWITAGSHSLVLFVASVLRVVFVPLVLLCKFQARQDPVFNSDVYPIVFVSLIGLTNGYFGSVAMISAPQSLPADQRETASTIMAFFLSFGLLVGSCFSFLWAYVANLRYI
ncbi:equilibrative nucleoside transporter 3-like [Halichondria panicea]|uniref:equilibrative nucleoside transporter 3-like n=1 Tax=Halichondria panicea TaxID=6063 RepID=UPI00312B487E